MGVADKNYKEPWEFLGRLLSLVIETLRDLDQLLSDVH